MILLDIYPARELPIEGVNSEWLLSKISIKKKKLSSKEKLVGNIIESNAQIIVVMGAGDIGELVSVIEKKLTIEN